MSFALLGLDPSPLAPAGRQMGVGTGEGCRAKAEGGVGGEPTRPRWVVSYSAERGRRPLAVDRGRKSGASACDKNDVLSQLRQQEFPLYHCQWRRKLLLHFRDLIPYSSFYLLSTINDAINLCQEANRKFGISLAHHESFRYNFKFTNFLLNLLDFIRIRYILHIRV
jgi:hypothetical protein